MFEITQVLLSTRAEPFLEDPKFREWGWKTFLAFERHPHGLDVLLKGVERGETM